MNETIKGYHGTSKDNASLIIKDNFRINKDENNKLYLGTGVYFFYKIDDAVDWNIKLFEKEYSSVPKWQELIDNYSVVESEIYVDNRDILDLDQKENLYKLEMLIKKFEKKLESRQDYWTAKRKTSAIINYLYEIKEIKKKVVIRTFFEQIRIEKFNELKLYPRKMFCVKDISIISKNKEKLDIEESLFNSIIYFY